MTRSAEEANPMMDPVTLTLSALRGDLDAFARLDEDGRRAAIVAGLTMGLHPLPLGARLGIGMTATLRVFDSLPADQRDTIVAAIHRVRSTVPA